MIDLTHDEALLFRILSGFFGRERVVPRMSVKSVCGDKLPAKFQNKESFDINKWAIENKCLFTIVDESDNPYMVIEFFSGFEKSVDVVEVEHQTFLPEILKSAGIRYITMTNQEFLDLTNPNNSFDFLSFIKAKVSEDLSV